MSKTSSLMNSVNSHAGKKESVPVLSKEKLAAFESYRSHDAFHPPTWRVLAFWAFITFLVFLIVFLLNYLDQFLHGLRFVPHLVVSYIILCIIRLWVQCEWSLWTAWRRGLKFEARDAFKVSWQQEVANLKKKLCSNGPCPALPHGSPKILCIAGYGGGGHEATLNGVRAVMADADFKPTIMDVPVGFLIETSEKNPLWFVFGVTGEQLYNWGLRQGAFVAFAITWSTSFLQYWALRLDEILGAMLLLIGIDFGDEASKLCCRVWKEKAPDMICNFTTGTSKFMTKGLQRAGMSHIPVVVIISDFEGVGVHSWIETPTDHVVCGTSLCRQQAIKHGIPLKQVFQTSGMILRPAFYESVDIGPDRETALRRLGLDPERRTCLVFWGGVGSAKVLEAGQAILQAREPVNIIFLCGRNTQLQDKLKSMEWPVKVFVEGFTSGVSFYMQVSDMIVCKPGPGVASEAALLGLPILVEWSAFTLPQEVPVCKWVVSRGLGLGFSRMGQLARLVDRMCELLGPFDPRRQLRPAPIACEGMTGVDLNPAENKAVFEVPSILHNLLVARYGGGAAGENRRAKDE